MFSKPAKYMKKMSGWNMCGAQWGNWLALVVLRGANASLSFSQEDLRKYNACLMLACPDVRGTPPVVSVLMDFAACARGGMQQYESCVRGGVQQ